MNRKSVAAVGAALALVIGGAACSDDEGDEETPTTLDGSTEDTRDTDRGADPDGMDDPDGGFGGSETTDIDDESRGGEADDNEPGEDGGPTGDEDGGSTGSDDPSGGASGGQGSGG